jgi:uncharacterized membrane protein YuzA (DUF378 family)
MVTWVLLIIGGLNWGLMLFSYDIGTWGLPSGLLKVVYALVALSALYELFVHKHNCKMCNSNANPQS